MNDFQPDPLQDAIDRWKAATDTPPTALQERVRHAVAHELRIGGTPHRPSTWRRARWVAALAAAASLLLATAVLWRGTPTTVESVAGRLVVADALERARAAEREHAAAIAELQQAAAVVLARAGQPGVLPAETVRLIAYRERLAAIDAAIAELDAYLHDNPGLGSARTLLLATYIAKTELLREILAQPDPENA